jgi:Tol biopolymer transport system component
MVGRIVSHYELVERIGEGGMGVVYKARDNRLGRFVALKVLPPDRVADPERRKRFVQEARAASALNHPHIVTIHDIDEADGVHFITMEHVEGCTLAERIGRRGLPLRETLQLGIQIADALAQAHARGIVHRDLKPGNVMVTPAGEAKVLDFGLLKLVETDVSEEAATDVKPATAEGTVVGTAAYMSPEQAQGLRVDARSDIFSFGSMLYEMVTARRAFPGETKVSTLAAILREEPRPLSEVSPGVPKELESVIQHCMRKDPARRFQHMEDVRTFLEQLCEDSDSGRLAAAPTPRRSVLSRPALAAIVVAALATTAAVGLWLARRESPRADAPLVASPLTTYPGFEVEPSFSPDGTEVAFAWNGEKQDNFDIYRKLVGVGEPLRLTHDPGDDLCPAWSPDGRFIAFLREPPHGPPGVYLIPALGGAERRLADVGLDAVPWFWHSAASLAWTPDGKRLIVADAPKDQPAGLFLLSPQTGEKRRLTSVPGTAAQDWSPALSADGRMLAFAREVDLGKSDVYVLRLTPDGTAEGEPRRLTFHDRDAGSPVWTADGQEILFSLGSWLSERQIVRISAAARAGARLPERQVSAGEDATTLALSAKPSRLVFSRRALDANIYRIELRGPGRTAGEPQLLVGSTRLDHIADYSPRGDALAFDSTRSGSEEIWVADADGRNPRQLTSMAGPLTANPRWSPDGRRIVFDSRREGSTDVYLIGPDGAGLRRLTDHPGSEDEPTWSRDGQWIYFASDRTARTEVWKMPAGGGETVQVTRNGGRDALESQDGRWLYYAKGGTGAELWRRPLAGGEETRLLEGLSYAYNYVPTNEGVYFIRGSKSNFLKDELSLEFLDLSTMKVRPVLHTRRPAGLGLAISPDGHWLTYSQWEASGADLVAVENVR